jgi:hypothetical protein
MRGNSAAASRRKSLLEQKGVGAERGVGETGSPGTDGGPTARLLPLGSVSVVIRSVFLLVRLDTDRFMTDLIHICLVLYTAK